MTQSQLHIVKHIVASLEKLIPWVEKLEGGGPLLTQLNTLAVDVQKEAP